MREVPAARRKYRSNMKTDEIETIADMVRDIAIDVLERIGEDGDARFEFFKRFIEVARDAHDHHGARYRSAAPS
jgi:hypothetical protein